MPKHFSVDWHVNVSGPDHREDRSIEGCLARPAAIQALGEVLVYLKRAAGPGWVVTCEHRTPGPKRQQKPLETWTFETNDLGELDEGRPRYHPEHYLHIGGSSPAAPQGRVSKLTRK
jgi:hypothetical protein